MKKSITRALLCTGILTMGAWAQESSQTPKRETLAEAIRFEKYKIAAAEAQARKDAGLAARTTQTATRKARKQGQADSTKPSSKPSK